MCPKELRTKQILAPIKFLVQKIVCPKKLCVQTNFGYKWSKKTWGPKNISAQKFVGSKEILGPKKNFSPKNLCQKFF